MARDSEERKASPAEGASDGVLVQVCMECGKEYFYDDAEPPADQKCDRCGNTVFRSSRRPRRIRRPAISRRRRSAI